jgi:Fe-S cluster assembly protein SufD
MNKTSHPGMLDAFLTQFEDFEKNLNGHRNAPFHRLRSHAMEKLKTAGLPGSKSEEYKYTRIARRLYDKIGLQPQDRDHENAQSHNYRFLKDEHAYHIIMHNGVFVPEASILPDRNGDFSIESLGEAIEKDEAPFRQYFGTIAKPEEDPFIALNTGFTGHGLFIRIPAKKSPDLPLIIHHFYDRHVKAETVNPRSLFVLEDQSSADIVEAYYQSEDQELFINAVDEVITGRNTLLNFYKVQQTSPKSTLVDNTRIAQKKDGVVNTHTYTIDGAMVRNNLHIELQEEHCETHMYGLYVLSNDAHVDNHTVVDHIMPHSDSNEIYKGIMDDRSTGVFNGKIFVRPDAQKTNAFQSNKNILLSDHSKVNSKPQLEIWADDVKCSHGCTTGQIDEEQLFYLRSRGIPEQKARLLLLHAFANDVLENIKIDSLRKYLDETIMARLH